MKIFKRNVANIEDINKIKGYEGIASKNYFEGLANIVEDEFGFAVRTRRPAVDPFNCMLNIGYSLLTKEICGDLDNRNLNPYIGFLHKDKKGHPSLASDLIEEWRPVIVDSLVLSMIEGHELSVNEFYNTDDGCRMTEQALKLFLGKLEKKMEVRTHYLQYFNKEVSFREALWHQADRLSKAIESGNVNKYKAVRIR